MAKWELNYVLTTFLLENVIGIIKALPLQNILEYTTIFSVYMTRHCILRMLIVITLITDFWAHFTYRKQPQAVRWCLEKMSETVSALLPGQASVSGSLALFDETFNMHYLRLMRRKVNAF